MYVVVPLAGPDCYSDELGIRPLFPTTGSTLLKRALCSRWRDVQYIFVLREHRLLPFLKQYIESTFPGSLIVTVSHLTVGAAFSALAGISLTTPKKALAVDLADIVFEEQLDLSLMDDPSVSGVVPYFFSTDPCYSYLTLNAKKEVLESVEKEVISNHATAGVYLFKDSATYLEALFSCRKSYRGLYFISSLYDSLAKRGHRILGYPVHLTHSFSLDFH